MRSDGATVLGADDKAAVAVLLTLARALVADPPAGDVELVLTAGEEAGCSAPRRWTSARSRRGGCSCSTATARPGTLIVASPTQKRVDAEFRGQAAHAGIAPEQGRSAIVAAARAVAAMRLGRIDDETTANIGVVRGGTAPNVVAERCAISGEARSHDPAKVTALAEEMVQAAACRGRGGRASTSRSTCVRRSAATGTRRTARCWRSAPRRRRSPASRPGRSTAAAGRTPTCSTRPGLPALTLGVGFENAHSPQECMSLERLADLADMAAAPGARRRVGRVAARGGA